jgi:hypothetical protein
MYQQFLANEVAAMYAGNLATPQPTVSRKHGHGSDAVRGGNQLAH